MNKTERKSLLKFLLIYVGSSSIFIIIIAFLYYENQLKNIKEHCSMRTSKTAWKIKSSILKNYMENTKFTFDTHDDKLKYAIINKDKSIYFSNLVYPMPSDLEKPAHSLKNRNIHILKLKEKKLPFLYIVVEDSYNAVAKLRYILFAFVLLSFCIMAIFGYILSRILINPIKHNIEQLNNFIKDSSHELNTPITALVMIISRLKKDYDIDKHTMMQIVASTKNIKLSCDRLLFSANNDVLVKFDEKFNFKDLLEDNISFFDELALSKSIKIEADISDCFVYMDKYSANILINNLLSNAIKYSKKNKKIYIYLKDCQFSVKDEGIGIKQEDLENIFQRYQRCTKQDGGFGLGLDIVNSICEEYNITVDVKSMHNKGSKFSFDLSKLNIKQ